MPERINANRLSVESREIRVFISSTFRDMQEEREELVKQIFPQLRHLCESRGVTWGEVDLRWGVPDEAKAEGKVLPLCLAEIEHCRPYFIGLLGERYGWVPEVLPGELIKAQPWLRKYRNQSVTALEILHGVLRNPKMAEHSFFYFRDPRYAAARPGFTEESPAGRERLAKLKSAIRKRRFPVSENFDTPKKLGECVLRDLTAVIEKLYPERGIPDPLDRAAADHEAYAASRRSVYIGREEYISRLDSHAAGDGPPLVVLGESGGGKSALLANWTHRWSEQHSETPVLVHFIGAAPDSANWMAMLRRLLGEFQRRFDIQIEIPDQHNALRMVFANALHMVAAHGRVVLVLDALNQIEDREGAQDLVWLPPVIPSNVRLVVSTLPVRPWNDLQKRGWPVLTVEPLTPPEREKLIDDYLERYAKKLDAERCRRIAAVPQSGNGLYLTTLLNELRQFGIYEELDKRIGWYLEAANPFELYGKVIQRWEQDYEEQGSGSEDIVGKSLSRLWAARRGLSESELLELMGTPGSPLPRAFWSPLYLAAGDALVNRGGLLTFAHDFLREAVREAYLPAESGQHDAHLALAAFFGVHFLRSRRLDELPWQLQKAGAWQGLAELLAIPAFYAALWQENHFEVRSYWTQIETNSLLRMEQVYGRVISEPTEELGIAAAVGTLLSRTGKREAALHIHRRLVEHYRAQGDSTRLQIELLDLANTLKALSDLDGAFALYEELESLCRGRGDKNQLQCALSNKALILKARGDLGGAMAVSKEAERICLELGNNYGLTYSRGNQANILYLQGDLDGAIALAKEAERISRELGDKDGLCSTLNNLAAMLRDVGDLDGAMGLHKEAERICRELGNKDGLQASLYNQALIFETRADWDGAIALYAEAEENSRELGDNEGLQDSLNKHANILRDRGDLDGALAFYKECERLSRKQENRLGLRNTFNNEASILYNRGDLVGAMELYKEAEHISRELKDQNGLQMSLHNQANILYTRGEPDGAMTLYKESERLCRELGDTEGLQMSLFNRANILRDRGDLDAAMALYAENEQISRERGDKNKLQSALNNQGLILHDRGDLEGALELMREQERLCRELGNKQGLAYSLGNQASVLRDLGDIQGAMELHRSEELLFRELGDPQGLAISLENQARLLKRIPNRKGEARQLADEALAIATRLGYQQLANRFQRLRDSISSSKPLGGSPEVNAVGGSAGSSDNEAALNGQVWAVPSTPHPSADGNRAQQMNLQYQEEKEKWRALPWWKRLRTPAPKPPTGI